MNYSYLQSKKHTNVSPNSSISYNTKNKSNCSSSQTSEPKIIGDYLIEDKLGQGTFSKVFLGNHIPTREKVAIKILDKSKILDNTDKIRIEKEINILKKLRHNNIIQLYCVLESSSKINIITEYCSGGELFEYIVSKKKLMESEALRIFSQILSGVEYLHKMNVVHRDLKPENLLFDYKKEIKIADFGLSNNYIEGHLISTACGSPCYAAPEMLKGKKYEGLNADIWSCGIILFTMVCGYLPFEDENQDKLFSKIIKGIFNIPHYISPMCRDLIKCILNVDPSKRYTLQQIRLHPWFLNMTSIATITIETGSIPYIGINLKEKIIPIDESIIHVLISSDYKFSLESIISDLILNKHNEKTTTYYLLLKKKIKNGENSIADIYPKSILFDEYMRTKISNFSYFDDKIDKVINYYVEKIKKSSINTLYDCLNPNLNSDSNSNLKTNISKLEEKISLTELDESSGKIFNQDSNLSNSGHKINTSSVQKKHWGNYKNLHVNKRLQIKNFLNVKSSNSTYNNESVSLNETISKLEDKNTLTTNKDDKKERIITPIFKLKSRMDRFLINNTSASQTNQLESLNTFVSFNVEDSNLVIDTETNLQIKKEKNISLNLTTDNFNIIDKDESCLKPEKAVEQSQTKINKYVTPVKKVEIDMRVDLKSGAVKNFLQSKMKNSVKEQYDKYVKKSIFLNTESRKVSRENSTELRINSNISNEKKGKKLLMEVPILKRQNSSQLYGNSIKFKVPTKLNDIPLPYSNKKKILNTSVLSAKDEKSTIHKSKHAKNLSYDENFVERKIRTTINTNLNTPKSNQNKVVNLLTDTNILKNHTKIKNFEKKNVIKNIFLKDLGNLSSRKPEYKEKNNLENSKIKTSIAKNIRPIISMISKSPDNSNKLKLFNNEQKINKSKNCSPLFNDEKNKKMRGISQEEQSFNMKANVDKNIFPVICCKQNLDQIKVKLDEICGKECVTLIKNKIYSMEVSCCYKSGISVTLNLNQENKVKANVENSPRDLNIKLSINKLREFKEYLMIKLQSYEGDDSTLRRFYKILKNKLNI